MKTAGRYWLAAALAGAAAVQGTQGAPWADWETPRPDAALAAEFRPGWVVERERMTMGSHPETFLEWNRGYDGELVLTPVPGKDRPDGPLTVHLWHAVVHPDQMNWPESDRLPANFVPDVLPGAEVGRMVAEETWSAAAEFPVRVPVVRPRSCRSPATWRIRRPAALFGGYEVRDAAGREVCRGRLPARRVSETRRTLVGMEENDETLKQVTEHSGTVDRVGDLPDALEAYAQVQAVWVTEALREKLEGREALLRRLLLSGVRITGETGVVERIQEAVGTGQDGRAVLGAARPHSMASDGRRSLRPLKRVRIMKEDNEGCGEFEKSVFENEANLFARDLDAFVTWTWAGWLVFAGGVVAILAVVFIRHKGERRVAVWWALPGWAGLCALALWGGGRLLLDRQARADVTEYRLIMAGWPEMHCRAVASAMTFEPGRPEWGMPPDAVRVEERSVALDGWWARLDELRDARERRLKLPRQPSGMTLELEAGWFEPAQMPVLVEDGDVDSPGRRVAAAEDLDGVYVLAEGRWRDLGPMKAGERRDPLAAGTMKWNRLPGLPDKLSDGFQDWYWREPCRNPEHHHPPEESLPPRHDWVVVAWKKNTAPRVFPAGDGWRLQGRTVWVEQWP